MATRSSLPLPARDVLLQLLFHVAPSLLHSIKLNPLSAPFWHLFSYVALGARSPPPLLTPPPPSHVTSPSSSTPRRAGPRRGCHQDECDQLALAQRLHHLPQACRSPHPCATSPFSLLWRARVTMEGTWCHPGRSLGRGGPRRSSCPSVDGRRTTCQSVFHAPTGCPPSICAGDGRVFRAALGHPPRRPGR